MTQHGPLGPPPKGPKGPPPAPVSAVTTLSDRGDPVDPDADTPARGRPATGSASGVVPREVSGLMEPATTDPGAQTADVVSDSMIDGVLEDSGPVGVRNKLDVPDPVLDADDAPLPEGEAVALPVPAGDIVTLRYPSPFETWLKRGGVRVVDDGGPASRALLLWSSRRLPALWRALEDRVGLRAVHVAGGPIVVIDLVSLEDGAFFDHGLLRERLEAANVDLARFSLLGTLSTRAELDKRVRATWAPGTLVEVRVEDSRRVIARRRVRVGR